MHVRLAVLADAANATPEGKLNILGEFNVLYSSSFPFVWPRLFLALKLEFEGTDPREFRFRIRMIDPDAMQLHELRGQAGRGPNFAPGNPGSFPLIAEIRNARIVREGDHAFEVYVNDQLLETIPLYIFRVQEAQ